LFLTIGDGVDVYCVHSKPTEWEPEMTKSRRGSEGPAPRRPSCRAWADGLGDEEVEALRQRVEADAIADVALLLAHAPEWDGAEARGDEVERARQ
jgi:DNA-binding IclR family transcriptional regulator